MLAGLRYQKGTAPPCRGSQWFIEQLLRSYAFLHAYPRKHTSRSCTGTTSTRPTPGGWTLSSYIAKDKQTSLPPPWDITPREETTVRTAAEQAAIWEAY